MIYKVSVLGSCVSRDIFNSYFVEEYKNYFKLLSYSHQPSIISIMSRPIPYDESRLVGKSPSVLDRDQFADELSKPFLKTLVINQPDILLLDFYGDAMYGVVQVEDSFILGKSFRFSKYKVYKDLKIGQTYYPRKEVEPFFSLWKENFDRFYDFITENLPNTKIVLNGPKAENHYLSDDGTLLVFDEKKDIDNINRIWRMMDEYAISKYNISYLDYSNDNILLDKNHKWGAFIVHYESRYYKLCFKKLIMELQGYIPCKGNSTSLDNVILNSECTNGKSYWTYWDDHVKINYDSVPVIEIDEKGNINRVKRQCWSSAAEINADGNTEYCLSMHINFTNLDDDGKFFCIRTFKKRSHYKYSDCIKSYDFYVPKYNLQEGKDNYFEYRFKPKGKFIKIAPFINKNGNIKYWNIKLSKLE